MVQNRLSKLSYKLGGNVVISSNRISTLKKGGVMLETVEDVAELRELAALTPFDESVYTAFTTFARGNMFFQPDLLQSAVPLVPYQEE